MVCCFGASYYNEVKMRVVAATVCMFDSKNYAILIILQTRKLGWTNVYFSINKKSWKVSG